MRNAIITATGMKGSGKTYYVRALVERCRRALIADPEAKWPIAPGELEARSGGQLLQQLGQLGASDPRVPFRIVYRDDVELMKLAAFAVPFALRNCTLVFDEWAWACTPQWCPAYLMRLIQFGRERRINLVGTTREPQEVHNMLFSQADLVLLFHTEAGLGLDRLRRWYPQLADMAPRLAFHEYQERRADPGDRVENLLGREGLALPPRTPHTLIP